MRYPWVGKVYKQLKKPMGRTMDAGRCYGRVRKWSWRALLAVLEATTAGDVSLSFLD